MRAVVQRVEHAEVSVEGVTKGSIKSGLLVLVGFSSEDQDKDINYVVEKCVNLRIFADEKGNMNRSALELNQELLIVSQFTLYGDCRKGRRPSFNNSCPSDSARPMYDKTVEKFRTTGLKVETGEFQAHMKVNSLNNGPITLLVDSKKEF